MATNGSSRPCSSRMVRGGRARSDGRVPLGFANFAIPRRIRTAGQTADRFPAPPLCVWTAFEVLFSAPPIRPPIFHGMVGISSIQKHCRGLALRVRSDADDCIVKPAAANRHDLVQMSFPIWMSKTKPSPTWAFTIELNTRQWIQSTEM